MNETLERARDIWVALNSDPSLMTGLTVGQFEDLLMVLVELMKIDVVRRSTPIPLWLEISKMGQTDDMAALMKLLQEVFSLPKIRAAMGEIVNGTWRG